MANAGKNTNGSQVCNQLVTTVPIVELTSCATLFTHTLVPLCFVLPLVQFFITTKAGLKNLNGKHVVFGEVVEGLNVVDAMQNVEVDRKTGRPLSVNQVEIVDCGEL